MPCYKRTVVQYREILNVNALLRLPRSHNSMSYCLSQPTWPCEKLRCGSSIVLCCCSPQLMLIGLVCEGRHARCTGFISLNSFNNQTSLQALLVATPVYSWFSLACRRRFESTIYPFTFITSLSVGSRSLPGQPARTTFAFIYYYEYITCSFANSFKQHPAPLHRASQYNSCWHYLLQR